MIAGNEIIAIMVGFGIIVVPAGEVLGAPPAR